MSLVFYQASVVCAGAILAVLAAIVFFRHIRLPRPPIGTFNGRDVAILFVFIVTLPILYLVVPQYVLTAFLCLTFASALAIGYGDVVPRAVLWPAIVAAIGANILIAHVMNQNVPLWQAYWILDSAMVMLAAAAVCNLYIQGGMQLRHVAWFALGLAVYDPMFSLVFPITDRLANRFEGFALDPSMGFRWASHIQNIGLGDLLVFTLFVLAAYRSYGRRAAAVATGAVFLVGGVVPIFLPVVWAGFNTDGGFVVPVQTFFGPVAFAIYVWLRRSGPEAPRWRPVALAAGAGAEPVRPELLRAPAGV